MAHISIVTLYVLMLLIISVSKSRAIKNDEDFMVAGRSVPVYMMVGTLVCTWIGSGSLFGSAGLTFRTGISELWFSAGAWIGILVVYLIAARVRRIADYTLTDLLERRYKKHYKWVEELASSRVDGAFNISSGGRLFSQFLYTLDGVAPLATAEEDKENAHLREEAERQRKKIKQLQKELEQTEERAGSVHKRFKEQDIELQGLKRELREERENGEKLRSERKTRIKRFED